MSFATRIIAAMALLAWPGVAYADGDNRAPDREEVTLDGVVPVACRLGQPQDGARDIELSELADSEGRLRSDLVLPDHNLASSFCNAPSTLTVTATRLQADGSRFPSAGFSRGVDFTVRVTGWTDTPVVFSTETAGDQASAVQRQPRPRQSDINVAFTDLRTSGGNGLRLIAAPRYAGAIVISLSPTP